MLRRASLRVQRVGQNQLCFDVLMHLMHYHLFSSSPVWLIPILRTSLWNTPSPYLRRSDVKARKVWELITGAVDGHLVVTHTLSRFQKFVFIIYCSACEENSRPWLGRAFVYSHMFPGSDHHSVQEVLTSAKNLTEILPWDHLSLRNMLLLSGY